MLEFNDHMLLSSDSKRFVAWSWFGCPSIHEQGACIGYLRSKAPYNLLGAQVQDRKGLCLAGHHRQHSTQTCVQSFDPPRVKPSEADFATNAAVCCPLVIYRTIRCDHMELLGIVQKKSRRTRQQRVASLSPNGFGRGRDWSLFHTPFR
jgi:hypothetical protein